MPPSSSRLPKYVMLHKPVGQTPLEAIDSWRTRHPEHQNVLASYAGRLDPMASGVLLVLLGDECKRQTEYTKLAKEYEVEIVLGIGSDTGDVLGLVSKSNRKIGIDPAALSGVLKREVGSYQRAYPVYSSKTVNGKPLFHYALEGSLESITIPEHQETIHRIKILNQETVSADALQTRVLSTLLLTPRTLDPRKILGANFRIDAVTKSWKKLFASFDEQEFLVLRMRVVSGSGSYMRSLAGRIGEGLGTKALALSIHRTKIGRFKILPLVGGVWTTLYK